MTLSQWQSELIAQGAYVEQDTIHHFGNAAQELTYLVEDNVMCDLSHLALLEVSGADAATFLQGQVTNDVKLLNGQQAHYTGYCTPKGRLLGIFLALVHQDHVHLQMPKAIAEAIAKRLRMFVMRSKVIITDQSEHIVKIGLNGPGALQILSEQFSQLPGEPYATKTHTHATLLRLPSIAGHQRLPSIAGHQRFEIFTSMEHAKTLWNTFKMKTKLVGKSCWDWLEVQSGIPEVVPATQEQFVPQMVNLDLLHAINFKKGCYTGQEIVARTHYLGSVKRRTFLMTLSSDSSPQAGDKLADEHQNEVGQIVRVAPSGIKALSEANTFDVLAELRIEAQQSGPIYWNSRPLTSKVMPYSLGLAES
ncbi:MAG: folate-binding protein YgfZ [Methylophilales bacterium 28-44-11]|nr:MAG: folate-binding protein YgfZ [Methylophilales bacterium 28-44-11]